MPGRQKSGAEAPMDRGGGPASSPKQGLARRRKQMSRGRPKGAKPCSSKPVRAVVQEQMEKFLLTKRLKRFKRGLREGCHSPIGEIAKERFLICLALSRHRRSGMDMGMNRMGYGGLGVETTKRPGSVVFATKLILTAACLVFFGLAPNASAQLYTGSLSGTV